MITLYKGDDTGGQLGKNVKIVFHCDDAVDMSDVIVKFDLLGIVKREFTDVHDGDILDIFISHAESRKFPLGVIFAKMWGEDSSGKLRTFANRIPFRITLNLMCVYGSDGTDTQDIHVYSSVEWDSIANKPTTFPSTIGLVEGLEEALSGKASAESVEAILAKIPSDASAQNQLADKEWVDGQVESVAAYYITFDAQGSNFPTHAALINAQTYYSGGAPRVPTRNDYAVVLADETHEGAEYRYIFAKPEGSTVGQWEAQYPIESVITFDDSVTRTSPNAVRSSGIWSAIWGALTALPTGFTSLYDWVISRLGLKRDYTDRTFNTTGTVTAPALHAILTSRGSQVLEYYLPCTEDMPATPAINHVYTWRKDGAEFYITQGVSVYSTVWILYGSGGEQLATTTTDNANDGWFPDLTFVVSANSEVTTTKVNSYPKEIHDTLALNSDIPTSLPWSAITGKPQSYTPSAHASTHAASGSDPITPSSIGAYEKPSGGIPKSDLASGVQTSLDKADGAQSALTSQQLANIAAVSDALAFDATHSYAAGDPVVYNGTLYTFTETHTGAWTGTDVSAVDIIARLAGKLDKNGGTVNTLTVRYPITVGSSGNERTYGVNSISQGSNHIDFPSSTGTIALTAGTGHTGNLAALDASGNPTDAGWTAGDLARCSLASKTITNGAVTLDDRAINAVAVSSSLASLTINFPTATSGKVRDFGLRLSVASGITTAPELVLPQGVVCENADGEVPEIGADGAATILYFTETASGVFLVKGELVTAIS